MLLLDVVVLSAVQGFSEVLPVSRSGHDAVTRYWLDVGKPATALEGLLHLGTCLALVVAVRRRLWAAAGEGIRAITRPTLFRTSPAAQDAAIVVVATLTNLAVAAVLRPFAQTWTEAPIAVGIGLCATSVAVGSTVLAPKGQLDAPSWMGVLMLGTALGLATLPGASRVGAALVLLLWLGVKPARATELALLVTATSLAVGFAERQLESGGLFGLDASAVGLGLVIAFVAASAGTAALRKLVERRRLALLALWLVPLGLATIAYARALPEAGNAFTSSERHG